jgi:hypothetical protein
MPLFPKNRDQMTMLQSRYKQIVAWIWTWQTLSAQKEISLVLLRAECPLHPRVIEDFVSHYFLVCQY